jgi:hypothetical protein
MRSPVDHPRSIWRRSWWLLPELVALIVLGALLYRPDAEPKMRPAAVREQIGVRLAAAIERASPGEHHDHGHSVAAGDRVLCTVEVFGTDPAEPVRITEVARVYGYYLCAVGPPGTEYLRSTLSAGPVMGRPTEFPTVHIPRPGAAFPDEVRAIMPERYQAQAVKGFTSAEKPAALRERFERLVTHATVGPSGVPSAGA